MDQHSIAGRVPAASATDHARGGFFTGVGFLLAGLGMYRRNTRLMLFGLVPAVIALVSLFAAFVAMVFFVDDLVVFITPYMAGWDASLRTTARVLIGIGIGVVWIILSLLLFVTLTLLIGQPFYEAISKRVEDELGGVPGEIDVSFWKSLPRTIADSLRLGAFAAVVGIGVFVIGLIPFVGEVLGPVLGALLGGWVLALELTSVPFERRGLRYRHRKQALQQHRRMAIGFGAATFVCFLVPLGAVIVMPAAVAGATLLARRVLATPA